MTDSPLWTELRRIDEREVMPALVEQGNQSPESKAALPSLSIGQYFGEAGFYLLSRQQNCMEGDSWHESLQDAFHQAENQFGVTQDDWIFVAADRQA